jgi:hypothetical protein
MTRTITPAARWAVPFTTTILLALITTAAAATPSATIVAQSGFTPARNGFPFPNYGPGTANLDPATIEALFGTTVCAPATAARGCVLTPTALRYLQDANREMAGGHCFGMAALSLLLFRREFPPLSGTSTNQLRLKGNTPLQHAIAYVFQWQLLPALDNAEITGTPNHVLEFLTGSLRRPGGELYTLLIYQPGFKAGHAVTPYAIADLGGGLFNVLVYDSNWPGQTRRVSFNTRADTWRYVAAANPTAPGSLYQGNAKTGTSVLLPTTPGLGVHPCPFCPGAAHRPNAYSELTLEGNPYNHAHLLIRDQQGQALGYQAGTLVSQIAGGRAVRPAALTDWLERQEPVYRLPVADNALRVTIDGTGLRYPDTEHLSLIGPDHDLAIDGIQMRPGERETLVLNAGAEPAMTYTAAGNQTQSPSFDVGLETAPGDYSITATALNLHPGSTITISDDPAADAFSIHDSSGAAQTFKIELTRQVAGTTNLPAAFKVDQPAGKTIELLYGNNVPPGERRIRIA